MEMNLQKVARLLSHTHVFTFRTLLLVMVMIVGRFVFFPTHFTMPPPCHSTCPKRAFVISASAMLPVRSLAVFRSIGKQVSITGNHKTCPQCRAFYSADSV